MTFLERINSYREQIDAPKEVATKLLDSGIANLPTLKKYNEERDATIAAVSQAIVYAAQMGIGNLHAIFSMFYFEDGSAKLTGRALLTMISRDDATCRYIFDEYADGVSIEIDHQVHGQIGLEYNIEDAIKAQVLPEPDEKGEFWLTDDDGNKYKSIACRYPKDIMRWKLVARAAKMYYPNIIGGMEVAEDMQHMDDKVATVHVSESKIVEKEVNEQIANFFEGKEVENTGAVVDHVQKEKVEVVQEEFTETPPIEPEPQPEPDPEPPIEEAEEFPGNLQEINEGDDVEEVVDNTSLITEMFPVKKIEVIDQETGEVTQVDGIVFPDGLDDVVSDKDVKHPNWENVDMEKLEALVNDTQFIFEVEYGVDPEEYGSEKTQLGIFFQHIKEFSVVDKIKLLERLKETGLIQDGTQKGRLTRSISRGHQEKNYMKESRSWVDPAWIEGSQLYSSHLHQSLKEADTARDKSDIESTVDEMKQRRILLEGFVALAEAKVYGARKNLAPKGKKAMGNLVKANIKDVINNYPEYFDHQRLKIQIDGKSFPILFSSQAMKVVTGNAKNEELEEVSKILKKQSTANALAEFVS